MLVYIFGVTIGAAMVGLLLAIVFQLAAIREAVEYLAESKFKETVRRLGTEVKEREDKPSAENVIEGCRFTETRGDGATRIEINKG